MSINECWQGRHFQTPEYKQWRIDIGWLLKGKGRVDGWFGVNVNFYIKTFVMTDCDNLEKSFFDALVKGGIIKDDRYMKWHRTEKFPVKTKQEERIEFEIIPLSSLTQ